MTLIADARRADATEGATSRAASRRIGPRRPDLGVPCLGALLTITGIAGHQPVLLFVGLLAAVASLLRRRIPLDVAVPASAVLLMLLATSAGVTAHLLGIDLLSVPWVLAACYLAAAGAAVLVAWRRPLTHHAAASDVTARDWWALLPAAAATAVAVAQGLSLSLATSWSFFGTDLVQHMALVRLAQETGSVDYGLHQYPQGFHMLAAAVSVPGAPFGDPSALLRYDVRLVAGLTWTALALVIWSGAALALRAGRRLAVPAPVPAVAALVLGCGALVTNTFVEGFVYLGAAPSLLGMVALLLVPLVATTGRRTGGPLPVVLTTCLAATALAHVWQSLVLGPAVAAAAVIAPLLPVAVRTLRTRRGLLRATVWGVPMAAALLLAAIPVLELQQARGLAIAAVPGEFPGDPWRVLVPGLLSLALVLRHTSEAWVRTVLGTVAGLAVSWTLVLVGSGMQVHGWYPVKSAWFLAVFVAPFLSLAAVRLVRAAGVALGRTGRHAFVVRATGTALAAAVAFALWMPHLLGSESLTVTTVRPLWTHGADSASRDRFDIAASALDRNHDAVAVPYFVGYSTLFDPGATRVVSGILSFATGQPQVAGDAGDLCAAVDAVAGTRPAVVISRLPTSMVRADLARHGCAGRARVERVAGTIGDVDLLRARLATSMR